MLNNPRPFTNIACKSSADLAPSSKPDIPHPQSKVTPRLFGRGCKATLVTYPLAPAFPYHYLILPPYPTTLPLPFRSIVVSYLFVGFVLRS